MRPEDSKEIELRSQEPAQAITDAQPDGGITNTEASALFSSVSIENTSSPFPPPDMIAAYREAMPGLDVRLVDMIEQEAKERRAFSKRVQTAEIEDMQARTKADIEDERARTTAEIEDMRADRLERRLGQWLGFSLGALTILGAVVAAAFDKPILSSLIGGGGLAALGSAFIYARVVKGKTPPSGPASTGTGP